MRKKCVLCSTDFECSKDVKISRCSDFFINKQILEKIPVLGDDCFCQDCLLLLKNAHDDDQEVKIMTTHGSMKLIKKKKNNLITLSIYGDYKYPLLLEHLDDPNDALRQFCQYGAKLKRNEFKIIKNFEALDEHYRRIFTRVKYGILFT